MGTYTGIPVFCWVREMLSPWSRAECSVAASPIRSPEYRSSRTNASALSPVFLFHLSLEQAASMESISSLVNGMVGAYRSGGIENPSITPSATHLWVWKNLNRTTTLVDFTQTVEGARSFHERRNPCKSASVIALIDGMP